MSWCWYCFFLGQILYFTQFLTCIFWFMQLVLSLKPYVSVTQFLNSCSVLPVTYAFHIIFFLAFFTRRLMRWMQVIMESRNTWDQWKQEVKGHGVSKEHHTQCSASTKGSEMIYIFQIRIGYLFGTIIHFFKIDHNAPCRPTPSPPKKCLTIVFDFSWDDCNTEEKLETMVMQNFWG